MFAKVKYLLAIGLLFLIPACATGQATGASTVDIDATVEARLEKKLAEIVNTSTPLPPTATATPIPPTVIPTAIPPTVTSTSTPIPSPTPTSTPIPSPTPTDTPTLTPTPTPTLTPTPTPTLTPTPTPILIYNPRAIGQAYFASNGLQVTVTSMNQVMVGDIASISFSYTLLNLTDKSIDEASFKLFYESGGGLPQYGFFGKLLPGQTISRIYSFNVESPNVPFLLTYPGDVVVNETVLAWVIPEVHIFIPTAIPTPIPSPSPTPYPTLTPSPTPSPTGIPIVISTATPISTPIPTPTPIYNPRVIGQPYLASNGLQVTVTSMTNDDTSISFSYTLLNSSDKSIDEASFKLFYESGGGLPQYGFFGKLLPGQTISRIYSFNVESPNVPFLLTYPGEFFANTWKSTDLTWVVPGYQSTLIPASPSDSLPPPQNVTDYGGGNINSGEIVESSIDYIGDVDEWEFTAYAPSKVTIAMNLINPNGSLNPYLELISPFGTIATSNDDGGGSKNALISEFEVTVSGKYIIRAQGSSLKTTGSYLILFNIN